jgi:hypothetical protein
MVSKAFCAESKVKIEKETEAEPSWHCCAGCRANQMSILSTSFKLTSSFRRR